MIRQRPVARSLSNTLDRIAEAGRSPRASLWTVNPRAIFGVEFRRFDFVCFVFLCPFAPPALPGLCATMDILTPVGLLSWHPNRSLHLSHNPFRSFPLQPHLHRPVGSIGSPWTATDSPLSRQASPLASRLARCTCRIEFTFVWDQSSASGCSPPRIAATQLPSTVRQSLPPT